MRLIYTTINLTIWILLIFMNRSHMVNSDGAVNPTQIPEQLKQNIMVDFDVGLTIVDTIQQQIYNDREIFQTAQCKKCKKGKISGVALTKELMIASTKVNPYMKYISIGVSVTKLAYSIVSSHKIQKKLDTLNDKLDDISRQINSLEDELKASIEFNAWLVHINQYEQNIRSGEVCLNEILEDMKSATGEKERMKLANEFLNCYERDLIEESAQAIYRLTGKPPSPTSQNLFDLLVNEKGCDIIELSRLMMILRELMASAAKQSLVYYFFKDGNENRVGKSLKNYQTILYDIRDYYNDQAWHCFRDSIKTAKTAAMEVIDENKENARFLSSIIQEKLSSLIPWYSWTVAQFDQNQAPDVTVHSSLHTHSVKFTAEGETYFLIQDYTSSKINVIVVWQDSEDFFRSCGNIDISSTKVYFKPCKECSSSSFINSDNMIEEHTCNEFLKEKIYKDAIDHNFNPNGVLNSLARHPVSFVVANIGSHTDACINNPCLNEGICNAIILAQGSDSETLYTNSRLCMCKPFYEGIDCEIDIGNSLTDNATAILGKLREHFGIMTGIPDVIDIYYQINDLSTDIKNMQQSLQYYSEYGNLVSLYGKSIKDAEYISNYYHDFQRGKLEIENFGKILDKFDFDYILLDFGQLITGDAILVVDDFLTSKKKIFSQHLGGCTNEYSNEVKSLMRNLVTLDQVVVESMIWHARWKISNTLSIQKKSSILKDVHQTYEYAIERQKLYFDNWNVKSCPILNIPNAKIHETETIHCDKGLSYDGLIISVNCMDYKLKAADHNVTCSGMDNNGTLEWLGIPDCDSAISSTNWSNWSACSVTCDTGTQIRHRLSTNGTDGHKYETQNCTNEVTCCESAGNHLCSTGLCLSPDKLCDGNDDCGDNEDEDDCEYLRVGDTVAIKSPCGKWMSCKKGEKGGNHYCQGRTCPGEYMNTDDWGNCNCEVFNYIAAENRVSGQAIRHGDRVALRYNHGSGYWLTCQDESKCYTHNCPGSTFEDSEYSKCTGEIYWILSETRVGTCTFKDSPGCIGEPIKPLDTIYLLHDAGGTGRWVSGDDKKPRLRTCDVRNNVAGCVCERWEIHIQKYSH